jgi:hypothetical protein
MHSFSRHTLFREYTRRPDGNYQKIVQWRADGTQNLRCETIIRNPEGRMIRVEKKRDRATAI